MKKILLALTFIFALFILVAPQSSYAQEQIEDPDGQWVEDAEVTFVGKAATRANDFLNWTLQNYDWLCVQRTADGSCINNQGGFFDYPLRSFWATVSVIPFALVLLFILASAFIMIITRGRNITLKKLIPRVIFILVLMALSFSIAQFLYVVTDSFQSQFLTLECDPSDPSEPENCNPQTSTRVIQSDDLLWIGFDYGFTGYRRIGLEYEESAYISLLLVKLTAITYYAMTGILLVRKIILWFFLIISSIFPLLLFFRPLRNTAKIWVGEFFRWLLYAPLFAVFLRGLVEMWRKGIPLPFDFSQIGTEVYPTAVSILLAGPSLQPELNNSVNLRDTFALYVVALIMLWVVIILPFLLLKIFLDYLNTISIGTNPVVQNLNRRFNIFNPPPPPRGPSPITPDGPPTKPQPAGIARALPFLRKPIGAARTLKQTNIRQETTTRDQEIRSRQDVRSSVTNTESVRKTSEVLRNVNISIPKMRDIARFETQMISRDKSTSKEVETYHDTLKSIANPITVTNTEKRQEISKVRDTLTKERQSGNPIARQVLTASSIVSRPQVHVDVNVNLEEMLEKLARPQTVISTVERQKVEHLKTQLTQRQEKGDPVASTVLASTEKIERAATPQEKQQITEEVKQTLTQAQQSGDQLAQNILEQPQQGAPAALPVVNTTQQVSLEDYEEVRKMWTENYKTLEPPSSIDGGGAPTRDEWIKQDAQKIDEAIELLTAPNQEKVNQGMEMVANILPFLLIGGFSKSEVIAYLKAKKQAGVGVLEDLKNKKSEDDTLLDRQEGQAEEEKKMEMKRELPNEEESQKNNNGSSG